MLAAVAIPAYQGYKKEAALAALTADSNNIAKATLACGTVKTYSQCDTATEVGVDKVPGITLGAAISPKVCFQFSRAISGVTYQQCVSVDISLGTNKQTNSEPFCYTENPAGSCAASTGVCTKHASNLECAAVADCPTSVAPIVSLCRSATAGTCKAADADCS